MGFAIDDYAIFDCIAAGNSFKNPKRHIAEAMTDIAKAFQSFKVVAFILHEPSLHPDFNKYLSQKFEDIDRTTGENLLVFALTNPSMSWKNYANRRRYHRRLKDALSLGYADSSSVGPLAVHALATRLGIPVSALPVIVVTQGLNDSRFTWVRTQPDGQDSGGGGLCAQLEVLSKMATEFAIRKLDNAMYGRVQGASLAEAACQALAPKQRDEPLSGASNESRVTLLLADVRWQLDNILKTHREQLPVEVEQQLMDLGVTLAYALRSIQTKYPEPKRILEPLALEALSRELLELAGDLLDIVASRDDDNADLSPVVMCIGKALETELNLSVVQWARAIAGIEMPDFFFKKLPSSRQRPIIEIEPGFRMDLSARGLNEDETIRNLPAVIGDCLALLKWAQQKDVTGPLDADRAKNLEHWIDDLRRRRNRAAHIEKVNKQSGREAFLRATDYTALKCWEQLVILKNAMRNDANVDFIQSFPFSEKSVSRVHIIVERLIALDTHIQTTDELIQVLNDGLDFAKRYSEMKCKVHEYNNMVTKFQQKAKDIIPLSNEVTDQLPLFEDTNCSTINQIITKKIQAEKQCRTLRNSIDPTILVRWRRAFYEAELLVQSYRFKSTSKIVQ